ncbi:GNAT family N-acetyltransferase [Limimaricola pyoseonensis]|uniref:Ribosomal protein S18 acetylase RimI n=1 Tax=Limimaricola pyoseonensis TaxID=521013 RepID=A0A1G7BYH4_9RHOB|nr:GNAT family N-acetyltransferase [Limimaricola pyoseonensis]SDE32148.1 Ribosomal protein S18 acetylase RimI [Limimaricola pyoseonensis]
MGDAITYRRIGPDDAALVARADIFDHPVDPGQLAAFVSDPAHELILALEAGRPVGLVSGVVLLHPDKPPIFFVNELGVAEHRRRRGIGAQLVARMLDLARARGCRGVWLATEGENHAARALYRHAGGRETGGIVIYDWDGALDA